MSDLIAKFLVLPMLGIMVIWAIPICWYLVSDWWDDRELRKRVRR